jgi:hypothetical protein
MVRKEAMEGTPDDEFSIEEMVILPDTDLWHHYRADAWGIMDTFMSKVESSSQDDNFPFLILSAELHLSPPTPAKEMQSRIYDRVLSCLELKDHPGSKAKSNRVLGDNNVDEKSYKLSHVAVHIVSQLQMVADDANYATSYQKFTTERKNILIFGNQNVILVGLMGVLLQLQRTSSQLQQMKVERIRSFVSEDPLPPAEEYRLLCTRYIEVEILRVLLRYVQKVSEFGFIVANGTIELSDLWGSDSFRILIWDSVANAAMLSNKLFLTSNYPFIEAYTSNVGRYRPMLRKHFLAQGAIASWDAVDGQVMKCSRTFDVDLPELSRQYPEEEWTRELYELVISSSRRAEAIKGN